MLAGCASKKNAFTAEIPSGMTRIAVDVENFRGQVIVDARSNVEQVSVEQRVFIDDADSERKSVVLENVTLNATLEDAGNGNGILRVRGTSSLLERDHSSKIRVHVPRCDGVTVSNTGGYVELIDVGGTMFVSNEGGGVDIRTSKRVSEDITVLNVDGDVFLQFPRGSEGWIELESFDGRNVVKDSSGSISSIHDNERITTGRLGEGDNLIQARTNNGYLRLLVMEEPLAYSRMFKRHMRDIRDEWFLDGSRRHTRNLPDDAYLPEDRAAERQQALDEAAESEESDPE